MWTAAKFMRITVRPRSCMARLQPLLHLFELLVTLGDRQVQRAGTIAPDAERLADVPITNARLCSPDRRFAIGGTTDASHASDATGRIDARLGCLYMARRERLLG